VNKHGEAVALADLVIVFGAGGAVSEDSRQNSRIVFYAVPLKIGLVPSDALRHAKDNFSYVGPILRGSPQAFPSTARLGN